MRVLFFGSYDRRVHPRVQVLQEGLRAHGDDVTECSVPLGLDTAARVRMLERPWLLPALLVRLTTVWLKLWRAARKLESPDAVIVGYMGHFDVHLARRLWPHTTIALDHLISASDTARDRGRTSGLLLRALAWLDRAAVGAASVPFVDTEEHLRLLPAAEQPRAHVVGVGAPDAWFRPPPLAEQEGLRVVFFGLYTPLQGAPVIGEAIALLADVTHVRFTMVGGGQELERTRERAMANPAVTWLDWVDPDKLPALVAEHDICLGIFGTGPKANRVVPNKVYQGAAAGCAVVTSDTAPQRRALGDAAIYVPAGDGQALAASLRGLAATPERLVAAKKAAYRRAEEAFRPAAVVASLRTNLRAT